MGLIHGGQRVNPRAWSQCGLWFRWPRVRIPPPTPIDPTKANNRTVPAITREYTCRKREIRMRTLAVLAASGVLLTAAESFLPDDSLVNHVEKKVRANLPTREERRFDLIGWAPSIKAAEEAAKRTNRPVYVFTYDGKIDTGRC